MLDRVVESLQTGGAAPHYEPGFDMDKLSLSDLPETERL